MRQSHLFTKTRREAPKDETSKNAELLIRAGFIHKMQAGVYAFLPLGERVISKIVSIIREEMNSIGGQEVELSALQDKETWQQTGRWDDAVVDNWFKTKLKNDTEVGLAFTHEEPLTLLMRDHIRSFRDLPVYVYQFQKKFRNEKRAKSGILRGREFLMKDLYSFSRTEKEHVEFYEKAKQAYISIFKKVGVGDRTYVTYASGGSFSAFSDEFQMLTDAGEDNIFVDKNSGFSVNEEVMNSISDEEITKRGSSRESLVQEKAVELGNIFNLGTKFSEPLELYFKNEAGENAPVIMGSYGIGVPRLMGAIVEAMSDDKGIVWPPSVAPFQVHLIYIGGDEAKARAEALYIDLTKKGIEVLFDDRDARPGEKLADADLIGIPYRAIIGDKVPEGSVEFKMRTDKEANIISIGDFMDKLDEGIKSRSGFGSRF